MFTTQTHSGKMESLNHKAGLKNGTSFNPRPQQTNPKVKGCATKMHDDITKRVAGGVEHPEHNQAGKSMSTIVSPTPVFEFDA